MTKHVHAELMLDYAKDAMETESPWDRWELHIESTDEWIELTSSPMWYESNKYRRKTKTININGYEVPEPVREQLKDGQTYYIADFSSAGYVEKYTWTNDQIDSEWLSNGTIHLTKEAAISHAEALLSFTKQNTGIKPSVDWAEVPPGSDWLAVDKNGNGHVFTARPAVDKNFGEWIVNDCYITPYITTAKIFESYERGTCEWTDSLIARPGVNE